MQEKNGPPMNEAASFSSLLGFYRDHLQKDVMPFWTTHCLDWKYGGINNCVKDDGTVWSTDKFLWSQGRALWTFSALYNYLDQEPKWLKIAENIAGFVLKNGRDAGGAWVFGLNQDGSVKEPHRSIYADAFVLYGLTEYIRATGERQLLKIALETFERTSSLLNDHTKFSTEPHPIPAGMQAHGPSMIFALVYHELGLLTGEKDILDRALELAEVVMTEHLKPECKLLYEFVLPGGGLADGDTGQTFIPGHVIESMWFMERIYRHHQRQDRIGLALETVRWHLERGWDDEYGGIFLACHAEGGKPVWHMPDAKVWWPATEALYALLRAYEVTGETWCLDWYCRVHEYAFRVYPDREHGDWHQNLDRQGRIIPAVVKGLPVKDPFHLPRALIYSILTLKRLSGKEEQET